MAITDYIKSCGYSLGSLKDYIYLIPKKDSKVLYHASDKTVNVEQNTTVVQKLECRGVTLNETQTLDSRFAFESEVNLTFDEIWMDTFHDALDYIRLNPCYIIIETTEGVQFLTNIELHTKYTYDYTFTDNEGEGIYAVLTFTNTSNTPLLRVNNKINEGVKSFSIETTEWQPLTENIEPPTSESGLFYESFFNYQVNRNRAKMRVTFKGVYNFKIYYRSEGFIWSDYLIISNLDTELSQYDTSSSSRVSVSTSDKQNTWYEVSFPNDGEEHFIEVVYLSNHSYYGAIDRGFVFIPNRQDGISEVLINKLCDYSMCKVSHLILSPKGGIIFNNGNVTSDDQYIVEWLPDTFNYTEEYNGEYFRQVLSFSIPLDDYQDYWEYRLSEFHDNKYCAVLQTLNRNLIILGLNSPLVPTYEIETSETIDTPNLITITFECYSMRSAYVTIIPTRWTDSGMYDCINVEEYDCFRLVKSKDIIYIGQGDAYEKWVLETAADCKNFSRTGQYIIGDKISERKTSDVTVNLNDGEWQLMTENIPLPTQEEGTAYESIGNYHVDNGKAKMKITFKNKPDFHFWYRSDAEGQYDYLMVSKIDTELPLNATYSSSSVAYHTRSKQKTWYEAVYPNDGAEHFIEILYSKDSSRNTEPDKGFVFLPYEIVEGGNEDCIYKVRWKTDYIVVDDSDINEKCRDEELWITLNEYEYKDYKLYNKSALCKSELEGVYNITYHPSVLKTVKRSDATLCGGTEYEYRHNDTYATTGRFTIKFYGAKNIYYKVKLDNFRTYNYDKFYKSELDQEITKKNEGIEVPELYDPETYPYPEGMFPYPYNERRYSNWYEISYKNDSKPHLISFIIDLVSAGGDRYWCLSFPYTNLENTKVKDIEVTNIEEKWEINEKLTYTEPRFDVESQKGWINTTYDRYVKDADNPDATWIATGETKTEWQETDKILYLQSNCGYSCLDYSQFMNVFYGPNDYPYNFFENDKPYYIEKVYAGYPSSSALLDSFNILAYPTGAEILNPFNYKDAYPSFPFSGGTRQQIIKCDLPIPDPYNSLHSVYNGMGMLEEIDTSLWTLSNITNLNSTFNECRNLKKIIGLENLNFGENVQLEYTFENCASLKEINLSHQNPWSGYFYGTFRGCVLLETIKLSNCGGYFSPYAHSFEYCYSLKTIIAKNCSERIIEDIKTQLGYYDYLNNVEIITE